jgi:hypothetical protein
MLAGATKEWAVEKCAAFWRQSDFWINMPGPYQMYAENFRPERRLRRSVNLWLADVAVGISVDLMISASRDDGAVPNAPPLADLKAAEDEAEADQVIWSFWTFLESASAAQGGAGPAVGQPAAPTACPRCGTPVLPGARFCGNCGADLAAG